MKSESEKLFQKSANPYRPDIDGLRAIAVLAVLLFHAFPTKITGGYVGVDVFFVISGFLITGIIYDKRKDGKFSFVDFWARRIRRIFPALILVICCTLFVSWHVLLPEEFTALREHVKWGLSFLANFKLNSEIGYFNKSSEFKPLLHLWSLAIEEQFYLIWPLIISIFFKKRLNLYLIITLLAVFSYYSKEIFGHHPETAFYMPWTRFWELQIGALLAIYNREEMNLTNFFKLDRFGKSLQYIIESIPSLAGITFILYSCYYYDKLTPFPSNYTLLPVL